jgi:hypothetical protein
VTYRSLRQTAIASVCISGILGEKLPAASGADQLRKVPTPLRPDIAEYIVAQHNTNSATSTGNPPCSVVFNRSGRRRSTDLWRRGSRLVAVAKC